MSAKPPTYSAAAARAQASLADIITDPVVRDFTTILTYLGDSKNINTPVPFFELRDKVGIDMTLLPHDPHLQRVHAMLCDHEKVSFDPETNNYVHAAEFKITKADDLVKVLAARPRGLKWKTQLEHCGTHMKKLVEELASQGRIYILYKDIHGYETTCGYGPSGTETDAATAAAAGTGDTSSSSTTAKPSIAAASAAKVPFEKILGIYLNRFHADAECAQVTKVATNVLDQFFAVKVPDDVDLGLRLAKVGLKAHAVKVRGIGGVNQGGVGGKKKGKDAKEANKRHRYKLTNTHLLSEGATEAGAAAGDAEASVSDNTAAKK
ncbi:hypothetical protein BCR44DRAFT_35138 [Catenaria anguillulae PL171]|uniref:TFA2 Winged helix domain-containing protein n=1 Tax=Catenaria anguillulae PL171 TaxID=765915 RepID=A0A1Y2H8X1_9FUNG|nr:hypothetical protein BCR44DRAFT_35138 [Catenaria anguillulae PL171]